MSSQSPDQVALVHRAQRGDQEAFAELFTRLHRPVLNYVYHLLGDVPSAEDVTQEAFVRAHQRLKQLGPPWDFKSWIYRIASNLAMDHLRAGKRLVEMPEEQEPERMIEAPTTRRPTERGVQRDEAREGVWGTLEQLPTAYRQALVLRELNGLSYDEVARSLECTYANARQLVHRARMRFREAHGLRVALAGGARCRSLGDMLSAYHDGELGRKERKAVEAHITACPDCRETRDDLRALGAILAGLAPVLPSPAWTAQVLDRLGVQAPASGAGGGPGGSGAGSGPGGAGGGGGPGWLTSGRIGPGWLIGLGLPLAAATLLLMALILFNRGSGATPPGPPPPLPMPPEGGSTPEPTATPAAEEPDTPTPIVTATPTPTLGPPMAFAPVDVNCRRLPSAGGEIIGTFRLGSEAPIDGRNVDWTWWWIPNPDWIGHCWVWDGAVVTSGDISQVPLILLVSVTPEPGCWVRTVTQGSLVCVVPCPPNASPGGACTP